MPIKRLFQWGLGCQHHLLYHLSLSLSRTTPEPITHSLSRSFSLCSSLSPSHQPPKAVVFGVESGVAHADRDIPRVGVVIPICIFSHMCVCVYLHNSLIGYCNPIGRFRFAHPGVAHNAGWPDLAWFACLPALAGLFEKNTPQLKRKSNLQVCHRKFSLKIKLFAILLHWGSDRLQNDIIIEPSSSQDTQPIKAAKVTQLTIVKWYYN